MLRCHAFKHDALTFIKGLPAEQAELNLHFAIGGLWMSAFLNKKLKLLKAGVELVIRV